MRVGLWVFLGRLCGLVLAEDRADGPCWAGVTVFQRAEKNGDAAGFDAAARQFRGADQAEPDQPALASWTAAAEFHTLLCLHCRAGNGALSGGAMPQVDSVLGTVRRAVRLSPEDAELQALLCVFCGMKAGGGAWRAVGRGPRVQRRHGRRAVALGPDNPRGRYLLGIRRFHSADGPEDARAHFQAAEEFLDREAERPAGPGESLWGRIRGLPFLGRTLERLERVPRAVAVHEKAPALQLSHPAVRRRLADLSTTESSCP